MVLAEIISDGIEPGTEALTFTIAFAGCIESQKGVVHEVGGQVSVFAKSPYEETLQLSGMTVVEFLEGSVVASCSP
jgi:hypothetical protein